MIQVLAKMEGHVLEGEMPTLVYAKTAGKDPHVHRVCKVLGISYILLLTRIHADTVCLKKRMSIYCYSIRIKSVTYAFYTFIQLTHSHLWIMTGFKFKVNYVFPLADVDDCNPHPW